MDDANKAADKARTLLSSMSNVTESDMEADARATQMAADGTTLAARQAQLAVQATSMAVSSCELIVTVVCNGCPSGIGNTTNTGSNLTNSNNSTGNSPLNTSGFITDVWRRLPR